jgi:uncharacterized coiled-coil DUF342 family protein
MSEIAICHSCYQKLGGVNELQAQNAALKTDCVSISYHETMLANETSELREELRELQAQNDALVEAIQDHKDYLGDSQKVYDIKLWATLPTTPEESNCE